MPTNHLIKTAAYRSSLVMGTALILASSSIRAQESVKAMCLDATTVPINTMIRGEGAADDKNLVFRLDIPSAGIVTLEVAVPGAAESEPKLGRSAGDCVESEDPPPVAVLIEQTATQQVLIAEKAGAYFFRLSAQDPRQTLGSYKLTASFTEEDLSSSIFAKSGEDSDNENMLEIEPDGELLFPPIGPWD